MWYSGEDDGFFIGHTAVIRDVVGFHGKVVAELRSAFSEAVEDYLETSVRLGRTLAEPSGLILACV
jgi:predicted HicB family RNase H-like nuclease